MKHAKYMPTEPSPQSIKEILEKGKHVILKGPPGTGKTHLAMETIREFIGETGAQVSIVRHQMSLVFFITRGRKAGGGNFSLWTNKEIIGSNPGNDDSFYIKGREDGYFTVDGGASEKFQLHFYDEGKLIEIVETDIKTTHSRSEDKPKAGTTARLNGVKGDWNIHVWDLVRFQRRIVVHPEEGEKWEYHLYRFSPSHDEYKKWVKTYHNQKGKKEPSVTLPRATPPIQANKLEEFGGKKKRVEVLTKAETFTANAIVIWDIVQFHPTYSYSDFVRGVDPDFSDGEIRFNDQKRTFLKMCESAIQNPSTPHVLIVDEINRAALGSVFGELILGLEDEYKSIPILTGNGRRITIPKNLALLGTMNSSDRSIGVIDHALKRRFEWIDLPAVLESSDDSDVQLLKDLNDLLAPEAREERGFGKWIIGNSGKCASVAFTIIPQLETLLREGELNPELMSQAAQKVAEWYASQDEKKYQVQISEFVGQHNPTLESIERSEVNDETPEGVKFYIQLPNNRINPDYPKATAIHNPEENTWTVLKGSGICKPSEKFGAENKGDFKIIDELLEKKIIHLYDDHTGYFLKNWTAKSKSMAARIPKREQTTDGGKNWKTQDGIRHKDWLANLEVPE